MRLIFLCLFFVFFACSSNVNVELSSENFDRINNFCDEIIMKKQITISELNKLKIKYNLIVNEINSIVKLINKYNKHFISREYCKYTTSRVMDTDSVKIKMIYYKDGCCFLDFLSFDSSSEYNVSFNFIKTKGKIYFEGFSLGL